MRVGKGVFLWGSKRSACSLYPVDLRGKIGKNEMPIWMKPDACGDRFGWKVTCYRRVADRRGRKKTIIVADRSLDNSRKQTSKDWKS